MFTVTHQVPFEVFLVAQVWMVYMRFNSSHDRTVCEQLFSPVGQ